MKKTTIATMVCHITLCLAVGSMLAACAGQASKPASTSTPVSGRQVGNYFTQWSIYGRDFEVADMVTNGTVNKLTFLNYAFANIYAKNGGYECDAVNKSDPGGAGGGDAWADYQRTPKRTIGEAPGSNAKINGNFYQLRKLKDINPNLKNFISLGGHGWSKWFSAAASTDALRKQLVSSCVKMFIKGDLPAEGALGGPGAAAGVFDGIDIDWEFPGGGGGAKEHNSISPHDKTNFTLLMAEFRKQLDAQGKMDGKHYLLTAAIGARKDNIDNTEPALYAQSLDWINVMTYDYHGAWGMTANFHSHLYPDPADPTTGVERTYNTHTVMQQLISLGVPRHKLLLGLGFYGRGWTGVTAGPNGDGLYGTATGPAPGKYEAGIDDYKVLKFKAGKRIYHPVTKQLYLYTGVGGEWWSYDDPTTIATKASYVREQGLGGIFSWAIDGDTESGELSTEVWKIRQ
jgi:chitinase